MECRGKAGYRDGMQREGRSRFWKQGKAENMGRKGTQSTGVGRMGCRRKSGFNGGKGEGKVQKWDARGKAMRRGMWLIEGMVQGWNVEGRQGTGWNARRN